MLFNSYAFILGFFPVVVVGFFLIARRSQRAAAVWLALASLFFYGWWSLAAVPLLVGSVCTNYWFGLRLTPDARAGESAAVERRRKLYLYASIGANLAVLGFFKYANFFLDNVNVALAAAHRQPIAALGIVLPIGISFFTFTQIAFLVDCWQGKVAERKFTHYLLFVTYFPHLIAGPVLHHRQMMPQFARRETYRPRADTIAIGLAVFTVGLAKKLLIADPIGDYAGVLFKAVDAGTVPQLFMSWFGVLAYTFQIYFDFSGYSDMAVGLSFFFGIDLPLNFNAPYQATSIIDFWRRWHMSLSAFLKDYLYVPLGGNRRGVVRRYVNVNITMLLGGLWHGANWTFVLWGAVHGLFLTVNHLWRSLVGERRYGIVGRSACWLVTFVGVCFAWVLFRASSVAAALRIYKGMLGFNGVSLPYALSGLMGRAAAALGLSFDGFWQTSVVHSDLSTRTYLLLLAAAGFVAFAMPPFTQAALDARGATIWKRYNAGAAFAALLWFCLLSLGKTSSFLYFQF